MLKDAVLEAHIRHQMQVMSNATAACTSHAMLPTKLIMAAGVFHMPSSVGLALYIHRPHDMRISQELKRKKKLSPHWTP